MKPSTASILQSPSSFSITQNSYQLTISSHKLILRAILQKIPTIAKKDTARPRRHRLLNCSIKRNAFVQNGMVINSPDIMGSRQSKSPISSGKFQSSSNKYQDSRLRYCVTHARGWRKYMEDTCIHVNNFPHNNHYLFGVFDGHGGAEVAHYVERHFSLELYLSKKFKQKKYEQALVQTFNKLDFLMQSAIGRKQLREIISKLVRQGNRCKQVHEGQFAGCTANVCFVTESEIIVANAGDSRCVASVEGRAVALSQDHHPQDRKELTRIKKAGGYVRGGRVNEQLNLSRSIGDIEYKSNRQLSAADQMISSTPDTLKINREGVEFIIMGCDGIWETKSNEKMVEWIRQRLSRNLALQTILQELLKQQIADNQDEYYGTDNMTALLIVFNNR